MTQPHGVIFIPARLSSILSTAAKSGTSSCPQQDPNEDGRDNFPNADEQGHFYDS